MSFAHQAAGPVGRSHWRQLLHAYVAEVQSRRPGHQHNHQQQQQQQQQPRDAAAERVLRHVYGVFLEEVRRAPLPRTFTVV